MDFKKIISNGNRNINYANGIHFLQDSGINLKFIVWSLSYDDLLLKFIQENDNYNEVLFLKNGIGEFIEALKEIESTKLDSAETIKARKFSEWKPKQQLIRNDGKEVTDEMFNDWLADYVKRQCEQEGRFKEYAIILLNYELLQFKIRIERLNVQVIMKNNDIQFAEINSKQKIVISIEDVVENIHPEIFINIDAFILFLELHSVYKDTGHPLADYSYIYRAMYKDKLIKESVTPKTFIELINAEPYNIEYLPKLKGVSECLTNKEKLVIYNYIKNARIRA